MYRSNNKTKSWLNLLHSLNEKKKWSISSDNGEKNINNYTLYYMKKKNKKREKIFTGKYSQPLTYIHCKNNKIYTNGKI